MNSLIHRMRGAVRAVLLGVATIGLMCSAQAAVQQIPSTPTTLAGSQDRMISYRHQNHMWQTADGGTHVLMNVGTQADGRTLRIFTSMDNGVTWVAGIDLPNTGETSTSDGFLAGNNLYVTYATASSAIAFSFLQYDPPTRTWRLVSTETVYQSSTVLAVNPTLTRDGQNAYWVAFPTQDANFNYSIKLMQRASSMSGWIDTGLVFGVVDKQGVDRSARLVTIAGGVGMVYSVHQNFFWATRTNGSAPTQAWSTSQIYASQVADIDPYGSHFSVMVDAGSNVHVAMVDGGQLLYFRWLYNKQSWNAQPFVLSQPVQATYMQILAAGSNLMIVYNSKTTLGVLQSSNSGQTWVATHALTHPPTDGNPDYTNPRMEAPSNGSGSPVPVLQQYVDSGVQRAMQFQVPVLSGITSQPTPHP
jgi:hypothetical protein